MRIVHLVLGLGKGGAETMLFNTLKHRSQALLDQQIEVVSFGMSHHFGSSIRDLGIPVTELNLRRAPLRSLMRARNLVRGADVVSSWLYVGNLLAWLLTLGRPSRLLWNVRHADLSRPHNKFTTILAARLGSVLASRVSCIAYNGDASRHVHEAIGYPKGKGVVLRNGCDLTIYKPVDPTDLRRELGINESQAVILSVARWHPIKDHRTFLRAFALIHAREPSAIAVLCGSGITYENEVLISMVEELGLRDHVLLMGVRHDLPRIFSLASVYVLHSASEAFPNTLIEAMACGTPFAATRVGEVERVVPRMTELAEPGDHEELARIVTTILESPTRTALQSRLNRDHIRQRFSIESVVSSYETVLLADSPKN